ncbi:MAG: cell envelope integrity protein TolA [Coxiella endosymbiont of Haemaphysalis qinghaiensis]
MLKIPPHYRLPAGISISCHIILVALTINLSSSGTRRLNNPSPSVTIIKAETVSQTAIDNEIDIMKIKKKQKREAEQAYAPELQEKVQALKKKQQIIEQKQLTAFHAKQIRMKQQEEREALVRKKILILRKQQRIKKRQLASEQQKLQKKLLQQEIRREEAQMSTMRQAIQNQGVLNQYGAQIIQAIQRQWIMPVNTNKNLSCILLIRLALSGAVLSVTTLQSSGDHVLDRSARVAVFKASPLPIPQDNTLFSHFRELRLTVRPFQTK